MVIKVQYNSDEERRGIMAKYSNDFLIGEDNTLEGNFLHFSTIKPMESQVNDLNNDNIILMDALATAFEKILTLEEKINALGGTI